VPVATAKVTAELIQRLSSLLARAGVTTPAVRAAAFHLLKLKGPGGTLTYRDIQALGYSRQTAITIAKRLCGLKVLRRLNDSRGGRARRVIFEICWGLPPDSNGKNSIPKRSRTRNCKVTKEYRDKYKQSKDGAYARGLKKYPLRANGEGFNGSKSTDTERRPVSYYAGADADKVVLLMGARFYRESMMRTRLELESWGLPSNVCDAIEGLIGLKIDGMTLNDARRLVLAVWGLKAEICKRAQEGATAHEVCSFICGQLTRWWRKRRSRSKRELLRRTNELLKRERRLGTTRYEALAEATKRWSCQRCGKRPIEREGLCVRCFNEKRRAEYRQSQQLRHPDAEAFFLFYYGGRRVEGFLDILEDLAAGG